MGPVDVKDQQSNVPACSDTATAAHVPLDCHKRPANEAFNSHKMNGATTYPTNSQSQEPENWMDQMICKTRRITHEEFAEVMSDAVPPAQSPTSSTDESLQPQTDSHAAPATPKPKTNNVDPPTTHTPTHTEAATESKKCMSEPELLVNAFQAQTWSKGKFNFATSLPYWDSIHTKFQGEWGKGFTGNGRTPTTPKSMTYTATYNGSLHALIRVYQTPLPTTPECQYKVFFNRILFWEIEALHTEEYRKTIALVKTYVLGLPDHYILQFFVFSRSLCSNNPQRNYEQKLEKAKSLLTHFQTQTLHSTFHQLQFEKGCILVKEARQLDVSSAACSSDDYTEALMKYVQLLLNTVTIKGNTVVFDHARFSATVDGGILNLTWCIHSINNDDADLDNATHTNIIKLMQLETLGDHLTSAFLASIDQQLEMLSQSCIAIEKKNPIQLQKCEKAVGKYLTPSVTDAFWFCKSVTYSDVEQHLEGQPEGAFVIRFSSKPERIGCFVLSYRQGGNINNAYVMSTSQGLIFEGYDDVHFKTLEDLVEYYSSNEHAAVRVFNYRLRVAKVKFNPHRMANLHSPGPTNTETPAPAPTFDSISTSSNASVTSWSTNSVGGDNGRGCGHNSRKVLHRPPETMSDSAAGDGVNSIGSEWYSVMEQDCIVMNEATSEATLRIDNIGKFFRASVQKFRAPNATAAPPPHDDDDDQNDDDVQPIPNAPTPPGDQSPSSTPTEHKGAIPRKVANTMNDMVTAALKILSKKSGLGKKSAGQTPPPAKAYTMHLIMDSLQDLTTKGWMLEGAENLTITGDIRCPVAAFVGKYSSGKSYIIGQMLKVKERRDAFFKSNVPMHQAIKVGPEPKTKGIGFVLHEQKWYVDTEGSMAPASVLTSMEDADIEQELSLRKAKQLLIERVIGRVADTIIVVLDRITADDQKMVLDLIVDSKKTNKQVHVVCNFKATLRNATLIELLESSFRATRFPAKESSKVQADQWHATWATKPFYIFALWKDHDGTNEDGRPSSGTTSSRINTATLEALKVATRNIHTATLDEQSIHFAMVSPVVRVGKEINELLSDVVDLTLRSTPRTLASASTTTVTSDLERDADEYGACNPSCNPPSFRFRIDADKVITPRPFDRFATIVSTKFRYEQVNTNDNCVWQIYAPGCELVIGKENIPINTCYVKVWADLEESRWEIRAKIQPFGNSLLVDVAEVVESFPFPRKYSIPCRDEITNNNGIIELRTMTLMKFMQSQGHLPL